MLTPRQRVGHKALDNAGYGRVDEDDEPRIVASGVADTGRSDPAGPRVEFSMAGRHRHAIRVLLAAGRPDWDLLPTITPLPL